MEVEVAAPDSDRRALEPVLRELLGRLGVEVELSAVASVEPRQVLEPPAAARPALARVFIDARASDRVVVYLVDAAWERVLVRLIAVDHGLDEVAREELAHIIEASVLALERGGSIGVTREAAGVALGVAPQPSKEKGPRGRRAEGSRAGVKEPPAAPRAAFSAPLSAPAPQGDLRFELGAGVQGALWVPSELAVGPLLRAEAARRFGAWALGGGAVLRYRLPNRHDAQPVGLELESQAAIAVATATCKLASLRGLAELGVGLELSRFAPRVRAPTALELSPVQSQWSTLVYGALGAAYDVQRHVSLRGAVTSELAPSAPNFAIARQAGSETVLKSWRLRPGFLVALSMVWGAR